jgi:hypothetical protein
MTSKEIKDRIKLLEEEILSNEEESRQMQREINELESELHSKDLLKPLINGKYDR